MQVYLPIAEVSVDAFLLLGLGALVGFLGGLFGVGGGFLMTPALLLIGIPPAVAVASGANQIVASSISGAVSQWRKGNVDVTMGVVLLISGVLGAGAGVLLFRVLQQAGQIDIVIQLSYVLLLSVVGAMMAFESLRTVLRRRGAARPPGKLHQHFWVHRWPLKMRFRRSKLYISAIPPATIGFAVGVLTAIMGIGGGFIMVPAMIYLFGMPTLTVVGTSQFQIVFVTAMTTLLLAATTHTVDVILAILLIVGGVVGTQMGTRAGQIIRGEFLRGLLAFLVLAMALKLGYDLIAPPADLFSIGVRAVNAAPAKALASALAVLALAATAPPARAQQVIADLASHRVAITTGFAGAEVLLFGAVDGEGDVIVTVRGPESDTVVRRKSQVNGMWINTASVTFYAVPSYYSVAASRPVDEIITAPVAEREQIGATRLRFTAERNVPADTVDLFRRALIRNMERAELFQPRISPVRFLGQRLFRADFRFPATVPTGRFTVNVYLVRDGQVVSATTTPLFVEKTGLSAEVYDFAQNRGLSYGLIAVAFAGLAGWAASRLFQRA